MPEQHTFFGDCKRLLVGRINFRKFVRNQKGVLLVTLGLAAMISFVVLPIVLQNLNVRQVKNPVVVSTSKYGNLRESDLQNLRAGRQKISALLYRLGGAIVQAKGDPSIIQRVRQRFGADPRDQELPMDEESIVDTWLFAQRAEELGIVVSDSAIRQLVIDMTTAQKVTSPQVGQILGTLRMSERELVSLLRYELLAVRLKEMFYLSLEGATPAQRWEYFERLSLKASLEVAPIPVAQFAPEVADPSDEDLQDFFDKYKNKPHDPSSPDPGFRVPKKVALEYFKGNYEDLVDPASVSQEEVEGYYHKYKDRYYVRESLPEVEEQPGEGPTPEPGETPSAEETPPSKEVEPGETESAEPGESEPAEASETESAEPGETEPAEVMPAETEPEEAGEPATAEAEPGEGESPSPEEPPAEEPVMEEPEPAATEESPATEEPAAEGPASEASAEPPPVAEEAAPTEAAPTEEAPVEEAGEPSPAAEEPPAEDAPPSEDPEPAAAESDETSRMIRPSPFRLAAMLQEEAEESAPEDTPAEETSSEEAPGEAAPTEETPTEEGPAETAPADESPAKDAPADEEPTTEEPAGGKPTPPAAEEQPPEEPTPSQPPPGETEPAEMQPEGAKPAEPDKPEAETSEPDEPKPAEADQPKPVEAESPATPPAERTPAEREMESIVDTAVGLPPSKYIPLAEVEGEIRRRLAEAKAQAVAERLRDKMQKYDDDRVRAEVKHTEPPKEPDFTALAKKDGMTAHKTGLVSRMELFAVDIGQSMFNGDALVRSAFENLPTDRPGVSQDIAGNYYVFWKVDETEERVPELNDDGVRQKVVEAWKMVQARSLARDEAEKLAADAREAKGSLAESIGDRPGIVVHRTEPFSWLSVSPASRVSGFPDVQISHIRVKAEGAAAAARREAVVYQGDDFMREVFRHDPGEIGVAMNHPKDVVYVFRVTDMYPPKDTLPRLFLKQPERTELLSIVVEMQEANEARQEWRDDLRESAGFKWEREPVAPR